jgi:hypothetical protein
MCRGISSMKLAPQEKAGMVETKGSETQKGGGYPYWWRGGVGCLLESVAHAHTPKINRGVASEQERKQSQQRGRGVVTEGPAAGHSKTAHAGGVGSLKTVRLKLQQHCAAAVLGL